jgi:catechol 2,3-dioxygenase-like lactoylglutathione lyase family enzyme
MNIAVTAIATSDPDRVLSELPVVEWQRLLLNEEIRHLVVMFPDGDVGVVSLRDVLAVLLQTANPDVWLDTADRARCAEVEPAVVSPQGLLALPLERAKRDSLYSVRVMKHVEITGLHHVRVPVASVELSCDWYARVFGLELLILEEDEDSVTGALMVHESGVVVGLHRAPERAAALRHFPLLGLSVDDIESWSSRLYAMGIDHSDIKDAHLGRCVCIEDPDGIGIELHTVTQPSVHAT